MMRPLIDVIRDGAVHSTAVKKYLELMKRCLVFMIVGAAGMVIGVFQTGWVIWSAGLATWGVAFAFEKIYVDPRFEVEMHALEEINREFERIKHESITP